MFKKIYNLEKKINFVFNNKKLLNLALTHKSYSKNNNERLEFLGDSILNFVITKNLYFLFYNLNEGNMTKIRSFLIKSKTILKVSKKFNIKKYLYIKNIKYDDISNLILVNTFESILAAIFIDSNLETVEKIIMNIYNTYFNLISKYSLKIIKDNKTYLQEISNKYIFSNPKYILYDIKNIKKNNKYLFFIMCQLCINNINIIKTASSYNKKDAENLAAKKIINLIKNKKLF